MSPRLPAAEHANATLVAGSGWYSFNSTNDYTLGAASFSWFRRLTFTVAAGAPALLVVSDRGVPSELFTIFNADATQVGSSGGAGTSDLRP